MSHKISIITVNYNDKNGLEKTIQSVVGQSVKSFEFIVIDGNSNDGSKEIIEQYSNNIDYWISEPDSGVYNAMNKGIRAASGDYVIFMNGGDIFYDHKVIENILPLLSDEFKIYYGDVIVKKSNSERHKTYPDLLSFSYFYTNALCHQTCFIQRQLFYDYFFYNEDYKIYSDGEFFIYTICKQNVPYKHLDMIIAVYDFNGISSNPKYEKLHEEERMKSIRKFFPAFADDYKVLCKLNSKRVKQVFYIEKFPFAWKMVKGFMNFILLFLPKLKK